MAAKPEALHGHALALQHMSHPLRRPQAISLLGLQASHYRSATRSDRVPRGYRQFCEASLPFPWASIASTTFPRWLQRRSRLMNSLSSDITPFRFEVIAAKSCYCFSSSLSSRLYAFARRCIAAFTGVTGQLSFAARFLTVYPRRMLIGVDKTLRNGKGGVGGEDCNT